MPEKYRWRKESGIGCILAVELKLPPDGPKQSTPNERQSKNHEREDNQKVVR